MAGRSLVLPWPTLRSGSFSDVYRARSVRPGGGYFDRQCPTRCNYESALMEVRSSGGRDRRANRTSSTLDRRRREDEHKLDVEETWSLQKRAVTG
jgi:hypothetical protein